jgi:hypothetical protein
MAALEFDYKSDVKRYVKVPNARAVEKIATYCGIALRGLDSRWVSAKDAAEVKRIVNGFCAKKLDLDAKAASAAIQAVADKMKDDKNKHRVTFYYLLAEHTGTLSRLG